MMYTVCNRHPLVEMCMLFVGTSIIHHSTEGIFILCNIWDLLIYSFIYAILLNMTASRIVAKNIIIESLYCRSARFAPQNVDEMIDGILAIPVMRQNLPASTGRNPTK